MKLRLFSLLLALLLIFSACAQGQQYVPTDPTIGVTDPTTLPTDPTESTTLPADPTDPTTAPTDATESTESTEPPTEPHQCSEEDPYQGVDKTAFYENYTPACCWQNAQYRSDHGLLSGVLYVPGQYAEEADYQPMQGDTYVRNTATCYIDDGKTYIVVDGYGNEVLRIYEGGGYITLEEVAAYMYAFGGATGSLPANYDSNKKAKPSSSIWGEYLRVNHSKFSGDTYKYPYEPELPDITGCGGSLQYYEMDIGTTGTITPGYTTPVLYNNGSKITRGAARLVYTRYDKNNNGIFEQNEVYVFFTHNHYNDFREYLNYYGGWGEMFGNVTGGGTFDSDYNYNPTPYPKTQYADFLAA